MVAVNFSISFIAAHLTLNSQMKFLFAAWLISLLMIVASLRSQDTRGIRGVACLSKFAHRPSNHLEQLCRSGLTVCVLYDVASLIIE